ncbi:hypothetical protein CC1G_13928 [Coprinopsis cinerea okayama7|uniref:Uncharacterized protein n=1 Tax=Coprinopsis cinerea (strain Okayama-7 / 130 / ATCC MYA-4618 / FGSC 9003) TaxID=240176 RepID=D6RKN6_COPC7|nr:hypothetical protein CC1G_13928 [Coprinopsis cinerea okayama7\|eukprot:XP_002911888.1 hypothetical protein CC1G_13928 [Coprinopsis cinerea okayama7\
MYFDIPRAGSRTFNSLTQDLVTNAIASSPDGGLTIVLSKLDLSDVPVDAVYLLARTGKTKPDDDCTIER